ncbi:MAG: hypothetical protein AAGN66_01840 [Acidobacteriota bacterium]
MRSMPLPVLSSDMGRRPEAWGSQGGRLRPGPMAPPALMALALWATLCTGAVAQSEPPAPDPAASMYAADPFSTAPRYLQARRLRGLSGEVASLILKADPGGEILMETHAVTLPGDGKAEVRVFVEIDGSSFLEHNQADLARIEVYAYALGPGGALAGYLAEAFAVDVEELGEAVWQSGFELYGQLALPPGTYDLRVLVRNQQSKAAGLRHLKLEVPSVQGGAPALLAPAFPHPAERERWLPVRQWHADLLDGLVDDPIDDPMGDAPVFAPYPFVAAGEVISPSAKPVLAVGRGVRTVLFGQGLGALGGGRLVLEDDAGAAVASVPLRVERRGSSGREGLDAFEVGFEVPRVPPGTYAARAVVGQVRSPSVGITVVEADARERQLVWSDLRWRGTGAVAQSREAPAAGAVDTRDVAKRRVRNLAASYRDILGRLGSDTRPAILSSLLELESEASGERKGFPSLMAAQVHVAQELAAADAEALMPIVTLHRDLYLTYRNRQRFALGAHSRLLVERLAELYAERGGSQGSRVVTARVLSELGGHLLETKLYATAQRLFRRALQHDPRCRPALLALAVSYERLGAYRRSVDALESLVESEPRFTEGLLRLAVGTARLGDRTRARELHSQVLDLSGPGWVRLVSAQELARGKLGTGDAEGAMEILESVTEQVPPDPSTLVLLAHLEDRLRRPHRASQRLGDIEPGRPESPRRRYDSWPDAAFADAREDVDEAARQRTPRLLDLLSTEGAP